MRARLLLASVPPKPPPSHPHPTPPAAWRSVDRCAAAATCCLAGRTARLDQSHVGHQQSSGTSVDELISSLVSISSALPLSSSPPRALRLPCCRVRKKEDEGEDLSRLARAMTIVATDYLPCSLNARGFVLLVSGQRQGNTGEERHKGDKTLPALKFAADCLSTAGPYRFSFPVGQVTLPCRCTVHSCAASIQQEWSNTKSSSPAFEFNLNKFVSECI